MAIYMKYGSIKGAVTTQGFAGWMELDTFQWGAARLIGSAQGSQANRESSTPTIKASSMTVGAPKVMCRPRMRAPLRAASLTAS